jgi:hypothetical protein
MTKEEALAAVEAAPWDEYNSALQGSDIWGVHGEFASPRATNNYSYDQAVAVVEDYFD